MEENSINIPDPVMEQLRCSQCKEYLSCGPVRVLPNGTCICGQCTPPNSDTLVYRELILEETILKNVGFPCRFKTNGCRHNVAFGQAMEHESKCVYQLYHCPLPVSNDETCCWSGLRSELLDHLTKNHPSCLLEAASFIIQIDQNCQGIFVMLKDDLVFLVTYLYLANTCSLNYDVRYFNRDGAVSASYEIKIENNNIPDCYVSLKEKSCPIFGNCFNEHNNTLNFNKYMEALDNPSSIKINIIVKNTKKKMLALETVKGTLTVDYEKLASLRCLKCHTEYLVFPIFDVNGQVVCFKCANSFCNPLESADLKLQQRIAETNFPCRWLSCNFIGTGDIIRTHELNCQFRDYNCPICLTLIATTFAAKHLQKHDATLISKGALTLKEIDADPKYVFIIENNKVVMVKNNRITECRKDYVGRTYYSYTFTGELLLGTFEDEKVIVQFKYQHCRRKSVEVILSKATPKIDYWQILPCLAKHKELSVKLRSCK